MGIMIMAGYFVGFCVNSALGWGVSAKRWIPEFVKHFGALWFGPIYVMTHYFEGKYEANFMVFNTPLAVIMLAVSSLNKPVIPSVLTGMFLGAHFSILTNQPWLRFWSLGFFASACQGSAHNMSGEKATLIQLNDIVGKDDERVAFEWAHVTFFPTLVFHSIYETVNKIKN